MTTETQFSQVFVDENVAAARIGLSRGWLRNDRLGRQEIPFIKLHRTVRYDLAALDAAMRARQLGGAAVVVAA